MTRKEFFKKCLDILLRQEFVHGMTLFECDDIDDFYIGNEDSEMDLSEFLDLLYDEIVDSLTERKE
jgi:hypothetical protein